MKRFFILTLLLGGCGTYLTKPVTQRLDDEAKSVDAPSPSPEVFGAEFRLFSIEKNVALSLAGNIGYSWKGDAVPYQNYELGRETRFAHSQAFLEMGVIPFPRRLPLFYPYFGIGGGLISADIQGTLRAIHVDYAYPAFEIGGEFLFPLARRFWKKDFYINLYLRGGYIFSFSELFQGPYISIGYSVGVPPEGIIASILGGVLILGGGE